MICLLQHRKSCLVQKEEKKAKADCKRWQTGAVVPVVVKVMQPAPFCSAPIHIFSLVIFLSSILFVALSKHPKVSNIFGDSPLQYRL